MENRNNHAGSEPAIERKFTVTEAARVLNVSPRHLRKLCAESKVPASRIWAGGNWQIAEADLLNMLAPRTSW